MRRDEFNGAMVWVLYFLVFMLAFDLAAFVLKRW